MVPMRPQTALLVALVTGCGDGAGTGAETSASTTGTGTSLPSGSTDWTGDLTDPTTAAGSTSTTGATEVDTTTGEPLVCIMPPDDAAGEPASWTYSHGVPSEMIFPRQLVVAADGSITTALSFRGEIDLGAGAVDTHGGTYSFLTRYSAGGEFVWSSHIATDESPYDSEIQGLVMAVDCAGNVIVGGGFTGELDIQGKRLVSVLGYVTSGDLILGTDDMFLVKFGPDGLRSWARRFGDDRGQRLHGVGVQADGTIVVSGASNGTLELDGSSDMNPDGEPTSDDKYVGILAAFDPDGVLVWKRTHGSSDDVALLDLAIARDDRIFAVGHAGGDIDFGAGPVVLTDDPTFIAQFEPDGAHGWSARFFDRKHEPEGIGADAAGGVVFSGSFGQNAFVARYDQTGQLAWNHDLIREGEQFAGSFSIDPLVVDDEVVIGGGLPPGSVDFGGGALVTPPEQLRPFLARYDLAGAHLASVTYEDTDFAWFISGGRGPDGGFAFIGRFRDLLDLGAGPRVAVSKGDLFIHRIEP
jgi:outer membrane protein assembly factor BamB